MAEENQEIKQKKGNVIFKYAFVMAIFAGVAGLILASVFQVTEPRRLACLETIENEALLEVLPGAVNFKKESMGEDKLTKGYDKENQLKGYVVKARSRGYSSAIEVLVGVDLDLNIQGVKVLSQAETPGLGTKVATTKFLNQFIGKSLPAIAVKKDGGEIDAVTGATISSRAVTNGVKKELQTLKDYLETEKGK